MHFVVQICHVVTDVRSVATFAGRTAMEPSSSTMVIVPTAVDETIRPAIIPARRYAMETSHVLSVMNDARYSVLTRSAQRNATSLVPHA